MQSGTELGRATNRLSAAFVRTVKEPGRYADGAGLYLYLDKPKAKGRPAENTAIAVSSQAPAAGERNPANLRTSEVGTKRWVFMFAWNGARKEMGLGGAGPGAVGLAEARDRAEAARKLIRDGVNPIEERKRAPVIEKPPRLFSDVAAELVADLAKGWKSEKHAKQWTASLKNNAPGLWSMPVREIDTEAVLLALRPIWSAKAETASRVRGRIEHVLDAARVQGDIVGAWENPARWKGHLARLLGKRATLQRGHHAAMPFAELPAFMVRLRAREGLGAAALEFTILTVARTSEVLGARPRELDLDAGVWTVPAERMKQPREHRVPLPPRAVTLAREIIKGFELGPDDWLFPGLKPGRPISSGTMERVLDRMDLGHYTVHGMRSSFRDWAGEATNFPRELAEAALAHLVGDQTERAYRRGDALLKRRKLMEAWAGYLDRPAGGNVHQFGTRPAG